MFVNRKTYSASIDLGRFILGCQNCCQIDGANSLLRGLYGALSRRRLGKQRFCYVKQDVKLWSGTGSLTAAVATECVLRVHVSQQKN
jgi:hypothetical protein